MQRHAQRVNRDAALDSALRRIAGVKLNNLIMTDLDALRGAVDDMIAVGVDTVTNAADAAVTAWLDR